MKSWLSLIAALSMLFLSAACMQESTSADEAEISNNVINIVAPADMVAGTTATITVRLEDSAGNIVTSFNDFVELKFSSEEVTPDPSRFVRLTAGEGTVDIYSTTAEDVLISIASDCAPLGITCSDTETITVKAAAVYTLKIYYDPRVVVVGGSNRIEVRAIDQWFNVNEDYDGLDGTISLTPVTAKFETPDPDVDSQNLVFVDGVFTDTITHTVAEDVTITIAGNSVYNGDIGSVSYLADDPAALDMTFASPINVNDCVSVDVDIEDQYGNPTQYTREVYFELSGEGGGHFYSHSGCAAEYATNSLRVSAYLRTATFYYKNTDVENIVATVAYAPDSMSDTANVSIIDPNPPDTPPSNFDDKDSFNSLTTSPVLTWDSATDAETWIEYYEISLSTNSAGGIDVLPFTNVGDGNSATLTGLTLLEGVTYYPTIRAVDRGGNRSADVVGDGWFTDLVAPTYTLSDPVITYKGAPGFPLDDIIDTVKFTVTYTDTDPNPNPDSGIEDSGAVTSAITLDDSNVLINASGSVTMDVAVVKTADYVREITLSDIRGEGQFTLSVPANTVTDKAGNANTVVSTSSIIKVTQISVDEINVASSAGDLLGQSVAIDGQVALVSKYLYDIPAGVEPQKDDAGAVVVLRNSDGVEWNLETTLTASDAAANDHFGYEVALNKEIAVVGAIGSDTNGVDAGAAYVYRFRYDSDSSLYEWEETKLLPPTVAAGDLFGHAVAIDREVVVVGAIGDDDKGSDAGAVYVYRYDGTTFSLTHTLTASDGEAEDLYGSSVAVWGNVMAVGAYGSEGEGNTNDFAGTVYIYRYDGTNWNEETILYPSDPGEDDYFGRSVSLQGDLLVVGAPGSDDDGNETGSAYAFRYRASTGWEQIKKFTASNPLPGDMFGEIVVAGDDSVVVGAPKRSRGGYSYTNDAGFSFIHHTLKNGMEDRTFNNILVELPYIYIATDKGILYSIDSGNHYTFRDTIHGLGDFHVTDIARESDGDVWVTTNDANVNDTFASIGGLSFSPSQGAYFSTYDNSNGLPDTKDFRCVEIYNDVIYVGTGVGLYVSTDGGDNFSLAFGIAPGPAINDVKINSQGHILVAASTGYFINSNGVLYDQYTSADGLPADSINSVGFDDSNNVYIGTNSGLSIAAAGLPPFNNFTTADGLPSDVILSIGVDENDVIYVGTDSGLAISSNSTINFSSKTVYDGLGDNRINAIAADGTGGVHFATPARKDAGEAYVYRFVDGDWLEDSVFHSEPAASDYFASGIDIDNDILLVGVEKRDDGAADTGAAFAFNGYSAHGEIKLTASGVQSGDGFAGPTPTDRSTGTQRVAMRGAMIAAGAPYHDSSFDNGGGVFVFQDKYNATNGEYPWEETFLFPATAINDFNVGASVDISGDSIIAGAPGCEVGGIDTGCAYVFQRAYNTTSSTWVFDELQLSPSTGVLNGMMGVAVGISGHYAVVGAPEEDVDGVSKAGAVYVFKFNGTTWGQVAKLTASDKNVDDYFGRSVDIDGRAIIVGAPGDYFGAPDTGSVYFFRYDGTNWVEETKFYPSTTIEYGSEELGVSVAIEGNVAVAGAPGVSGTDDGNAFVYRYNGTEWLEEKTLPISVPPNDGHSSAENFGHSVAVDGGIITVTAPNNTDSKGRVFIYRFNKSTGWNLYGNFISSDAEDDDYVGTAVGVHGNIMATGASGDLNGAGSLYIQQIR